jgi:hypothetical protein
MDNQNGLPTRPDGTVDWVEATRLAKLNPPASTPAELAESIRRINAAERQRIEALVRTGGLEALQKEHDNDAANFRRAAEAAGKLRQEAESKRLADALAARQAELSSVPTTIVDRETEAKKRYDASIVAIQEQAPQPIVMTNDEMLSAHARKTELKERYDNAWAESLRPNVDLGKF